MPQNRKVSARDKIFDDLAPLISGPSYPPESGRFGLTGRTAPISTLGVPGAKRAAETNATDDGIKKLNKALPACEVIR